MEKLRNFDDFANIYMCYVLGLVETYEDFCKLHGNVRRTNTLGAVRSSEALLPLQSGAAEDASE